MDGGKRKNDPYRNMQSGKDEIRPSFLKGLFGGKGEADDKNGAGNDLRSAEKAAESSALNKAEDSLKGVRSNEEDAGGFYSGNGKKSGGEQKKSLRSRIIKSGPVWAIFGLIVVGGGLMMGSQTLMPIAIQEMIIQKFNSIGVSSTIVSDSWLDSQLNSGVREQNLRQGETDNLLAFSPYQVKELEKQGMVVIEDVGGGSRPIMTIIFEDDKRYYPIIGSDFINQPGLQGRIRSASGLDVEAPISAKKALQNLEFKDAYTAASKAWRGGSSGWFDKIMSDITEIKLSTRRNRWVRYIARSIGEMTEDFRKTASSAIKKQTYDFEASEVIDGTAEVYDADGNRITASTMEVGDSYVRKDGTNMTVTNVRTEDIELPDGTKEKRYIIQSNNMDSAANNVTESRLNDILNSKAVKAAGAVADGADAICAIVEGLMSIYTVVSAYQSLQFLNLVSGYLEAVDKVKAGDGSESPIHTYNNNLTTKADTIETEADGTATEDTMGGVKTRVVANKTAMESAGMANLFSNAKINPSDASVQNVNIETLMQNISTFTGNVKLTAKVFEACGYVRIATAGVNLAITVISFIPLFGQGIKLAQITAKTVIKAAVKLAFTAAFYIAIPIIAKKVANVLIKDAATEWFGEDLGNALISGANKYLGGNGTSGGQSPGDEKKVLAYLNERNSVIAEEARYQRTRRSPFDVSSPYTFFGSLAYQLLPFAYSSSGIMSVVKNTSSITTSSIASLMPTANAVGINEELTSKGECPLLESVGAVGDAFCNPYIITDKDTVDLKIDRSDPGILNIKAGIDPSNFEADGYTIKKGSNLSKYVTYCGQRTSQYGVRDAAIAETEAKGTVSKIIGFVPVLSDVQSIVNSIKDANKYKWVTGEACVASEENMYWEENQYFARFAENERLLENTNPGFKSVITAYLEDYYKENPLDNTFEGTIARFAGMTKEKVEDTLALMEYYQYLDTYHPEERYAFGAPAVKIKSDLKFDNDNKLANSYFILLNQISFADIRNRSFAV